MQYPIKSTSTTASVKSSLHPSRLQHGFFFIALALAGFALSPAAQTVSPPLGGGYPGDNTANGEDALFRLATGTSNWATGFYVLESNTAGGFNTANDYQALYNNATGYSNFNTTNVTRMALPVLGESSPKAPSTAPTSVVFTDIALESGFQDRLSHGRALVGGDFNNDGRLDFFLGNPGDPTVLDDESFIFWNNGVDGSGNLILSKGQVLGKGEIFFTASVADYDNDGDLDLFVGIGGQEGIGLDYLFRNDGGVFVDVSETAQIRGPKDSNGNWVPTATSSGTWADYDNDGDLDLFVASRQHSKSLILPGDLGWRNSLFRNNGDGTFTDVTVTAGVGGTLSSMTSAWGDYNNDGWMDLYVPHGALGFGIPGFQLYQNNHDGTFTELNIDEKSLNFGDRATWAASAADFNNDGLEDIISWARGSLGGPDSHALLINHGNWTFTNEAVSAGIAGVPVPRVMGCQVADYDNDGDLDLVMANGGPDHGDKDNLWMNKFADTGLLVFEDVSFLIDYPAPPDPTCVPPRIDASKLFANQSWFIDSVNMLVNMPEGMDSCDNPVRRVEVAPGQDLCNPPYPYRGHGVIFYDFDHDGDLDMFMSKGGTRITIDSVEPNRLFRNDGGNANNWLYLDPEGVVSNKDAVGAKVKLTSSQGGLNPRVQYRDLQAGSGFSACGPHLIHFGLGQDDTVDEVAITWPSGASTVLPSTGANQIIRVREPTTSFTTFNDGTAPGWTPVSGSWSVQDATYIQSSSSGKAMSLNTRRSMADFSVVAKLNYSSGNKKIGLMGRASPDGKTFYAAVLLGSTAQLFKSVNGTMAPIGGPIAIVPMRPGRAYLVGLQFKGSSVQMWVDGVLGPVVSDTSITSGCIGLFTMGTQAGFDNVGVYN